MFGDTAVFDHGDEVGGLDSGETVRNENGLNGFGRDIAYCVDHIIGNNGMENGMKPEETVQKYVTLEEYSDSYK